MCFQLNLELSSFFHRQSTHRYEHLWKNQTNESCTEPWPTGSSQQVPSHSFFSKDEVRLQYLGREGTSTYCLVGISMIFRRGAGSDVMFRIDWSSVTFLVYAMFDRITGCFSTYPGIGFHLETGTRANKLISQRTGVSKGLLKLSLKQSESKVPGTVAHGSKK